MESSLRISLLFIFFGAISAAKILKISDTYPTNTNEITTCGNIRDVIRRNSARFRKILVRNSNADIDFLNDDSKRMTARAKSKLDVLASRVQSRWNGVKVKVLKAWTDQVVPGYLSTLHYEGRALQLHVSDNDNGKLGELAGLAIDAGFDWIRYPNANYIHASVIRDVCQTSVDLAFILDTSGSVGSANFEKIKTFVKNVIDFFNIGFDGTRVAVVTYSTWPVVEFSFQGHYTKSALKNAVSAIYYRAGWTYTGNALEATREKVFNAAYGMRPDKGIPKLVVLLTDGYSNGWGVQSAANALKKSGVNMFCVGVANFNKKELENIASDPDKDHVFSMKYFNELSDWVDKLSSVSCDEGAAVSSCDDTESVVDGGSFLYFRTEFVSKSGGISVEVKDIIGTSHLYVSLTTKNPGPMDPNSLKNEINTSPRSIRLSFSSRSDSTLVYVAVQGQAAKNRFKLSMWDTFFSRDSYRITPVEESLARNVIKMVSTAPYRLKYSIADGNVQGKFQIDTQSGQIRTTGPLDREQTASFRLTVIAKDINNACHKGRTVVVVDVKDINDNPPSFNQARYTADVKENMPSGTVVTMVTATDKDSGDSLSYSLVNNFNKFTINRISGLVTTTAALDFEQSRSYSLEVRTTDGKFQARTSLVVSVMNVNERPAFDSLCGKNQRCFFSVSESDPINTRIESLSARDPDGDRLSYSLKILNSQDKVFAIDSSGSITLLKTLDREAKAVYSTVVRVSDGVLVVETRVTITVTDVNDNAPKFPLNIYTANVYENVAVGSRVIQVLARDADTGINSRLTYSLQSGDTSYFTIDATNGIIKTRQKFDRERRSSYQLSVRVVDGGSPQLDGQTSITINILDVNDNSPVFTQKQFTIRANENAALGTVIGTVSATDKDTGVNADLRYSILAGNQENAFRLDTKSGQVILTGGLDYERKKLYSLLIGVSDRGSPSLASRTFLLITVEDVNDNSPVFGSTVYRASVKEGSSKGTTVLKVSANDRDSGNNGAVRYNITSGNDDNTFALDFTTGLITINTPPTFKPNFQYKIKIEARDQGQPIRTDSADVIISIEDINDNKPVFDQQTYNDQVREDAAKGTAVLSVRATDVDTGPRGRVVYNILSGNTDSKFTIDGSSGSIKVSSSLDRELIASFSLTIEARDGGSPPLSSTCRAVINITDVNDHAPTFNGPYTFRVTEDKPVGYSLGRVIAVDLDAGDNGRISYTGSHTSTFTINPATGEITLGKPVDHETKSTYYLTVTATDHGTSPKSTQTVVKVIVDDVNDNAPSFPNDMYNCSVAENMARGAAVCYVTAVDLDSGANGQLAYTLNGGSGIFTINKDTGEITTSSPLDRESTASYHLTVTVQDGQNTRSGRSLSDSVAVYVTVQDENDNPPMFSGAPFKFSVKENARVGTLVGKVSATDADTGPNGKLVFSILNGITGLGFKIDQETGVITVKNSLDREKNAQYTLTVLAKDSGSPAPQMTSTVVMVTIDDVNDNKPTFSADKFYGQIREDASIGSSVLEVKAQDTDTGTNGQLSFTLTGKGSANFTIDPTGFIKSSTQLDYETTSSYLMTVTATDSGNPPLSASAQVNITIINVNDNVPSFVSPAQITSIPEDVAIGTRVVKLNATDSDGSSLSFTIIKGDSGSSFDIGSSDGVISVAKRLDRESVAGYTLVVEAKDTDGKSVTNNATIRILDVNDNKPVFNQGSYSANLPEGKPAGTSVTRVQAIDRDVGKNAEIMYLLTSGDQNKFQVNSTTGLLTTRAALDREQQASYKLDITAKDHGNPSQSSVALVTVTVSDVNDNTPKFPQNSYSVSLVENTASNSVILRMRASDPDENNNGRVSYAITSGNTNKAFQMNTNTGELIVIGPIDRETKSSYTLNISARDAGQTPRSSFATVSITVTDENDNAPVFNNQSTTLHVNENVARGSLVGVVIATDNDVGSNAQVVYSIVAGAGVPFVMNSTNGRVTVSGKIDRETIATYPLTIRASDRGSPVMYSDKQFTIIVGDVNDSPPVFSRKVYQANICENSPMQTLVTTIKATDADVGANAAVRYQLVSGDTRGSFVIVAGSGQIKTAVALDYEKQPKYTLEVSATDGTFTTKAQVVIDVTNVNDNNPVFTQRAYHGNVLENSLSAQILLVSATDEDSFGGLVYSLNSSYPHSNRFNIDPTSGAISTTELLDRETNNAYVIQVLVADGGKPARTDAAMVTISVTDVNDNSPMFGQSTMSVEVKENVPINTSILKLTATDIDLGTNAQITYHITQTGLFTIDSGILRNIIKFDRETTPSYTLTCTATDHGKPGLTSQPLTIHVTVLDVNDNSPRFDRARYQANVSEDEAIGALVFEVLAVDNDLGNAGKVVYSITNGNDNEIFTIGNNTGVISLLKTPDRELRDAYTLTVQASDLGTPPRTTQTQVNIRILDVNDNIPQFDPKLLRGSVKENEPSDTYVMRLAATDADLGTNAQLNFNLLTDEYKNLFSVHNTTGKIFTRKSLDREQQTNYSLKISVSDMGNPPMTSLADVTINVIDVDDNCPMFSPSKYDVAIYENLKRGTAILRVSATDLDQDSATYEIKSGNSGGEFTIDSSTGEIRIGNGVDREVAGTIMLVVRAGEENCGLKNDTDGHGIEGETTVGVSNATTATVNITVKDENDSPPRFTSSPYTYDFNDINTGDLFTITATDDDLGQGGVVEYVKAGETENGGNRIITVQAADKGSPSLKSNVTVTVTTRLSCEAMVFDVSSGGRITTKTLCSISQTPNANTITSGNPYVFKCSAKGNTIPEYRWMLNGRFLTPWSSNGTYSVASLTQEDEGLYSCLARSDAGLIQSTAAKLTINDRPKVISHPENSSVPLGGTATLECRATGDPKPLYQWYKNNVAMPEGGDVEPKKPVLILREAIPQDEAFYMCKVTNEAGTAASNRAYLKVFEPEALISLEISVSKPNLAKQCHMFDVQSFKAMLNRLFKAEAVITNVTAEGMCEEDPCFPKPCHHGGVCTVEGTGKYSCLCPPGWSGENCHIDVNECDRAPCLNGTCQNRNGTYDCACSVHSTGKNCDLRQNACAKYPCQGSEICVRSQMNSTGYECLHEDKQIVMIHRENIEGKQTEIYDLEKEIEEMIKTAPNTNSIKSKRDVQQTNDYGACVVRIIAVRRNVVRFVLLCPSELNVEAKTSRQFVCELMFQQGKTQNCGIELAMLTPVPPTTLLPLKPMRVKILLFARDESNKDIHGEQIVELLQSDAFKSEMENQGVTFVNAKQAQPQALKSEPSISKGLVIGLAMMAVIALSLGILGFVYYKRVHNRKLHISLEDRAVLNRRESHQVQRNVSNKDITRSEKKFINQAFTNSICEDSEGEFMVEVNIPKLRKNMTPRDKLCEENWYYDKITPIEAEEVLDMKVPPGTFLARKGMQPDDYVITVKCPEGGPSHRHLLVKYTSKGKFSAQFGTMPLPLEFDTFRDVIEHFQVTPVEFGTSVPDVVLMNGWSKAEV